MNGNENTETGTRMAWVEPTATVLDVAETAAFPRVGADGGRFVDCTRS